VDWRELAGNADRESFARAHPHPFLLVLDGDEDPEQGLATRMMGATRDAPRDRVPGEPGSILAVAKSDANPYSDRVIVGRARNCDLVIRDPSVSKFHADFRELAPGAALLTDRTSRNGTAVNGDELVGSKAQPVKTGDRIRIGGVTALFLDAASLHDAIA
jgi:hypothetical protein